MAQKTPMIDATECLYGKASPYSATSYLRSNADCLRALDSVPTPLFWLRFPENEIAKWAALYDYPGEEELTSGPVAVARERGYFDLDAFLAIGEWKSARPRKRRTSNSAEYVHEVTRLALAPSTSPQLAIEVLTLLAGVDWATASVILHFCHADPYPILDYRALWSAGQDDVPDRYDFAYWAAYTDFTRDITRRNTVSMRILDKALWKYSDLHQGKRVRRRRQARD